MRTAESPSLEPPPPPVAQASEPPPNPIVQIFHAFAGGQEPVPPAFPADAPTNVQAAAPLLMRRCPPMLRPLPRSLRNRSQLSILRDGDHLNSRC